MKPGYNSHFVITDPRGNCLVKPSSNDKRLEYNELVVSQEAQVVPAFIFSFERDDLVTVRFPLNHETLFHTFVDYLIDE